MMAFVTLFFLTAVTFLAGLAVAVRSRPQGRAELLLVATFVWNGIVLLPIYVFGYANRLYPITVGLGALATSAVVGFFASRGTNRRAFLEECRTALRGLLQLPVDALSMAWRAKSAVLVGVVATMMLLLWTTLTAYLAPPWRHYDALWYHDTIIGFALQNHGFRVVNVPGSLARVNTYPRAVEMTQLWFVLFTDRRLIDIANSLLSPGIAAGIYLLCRRFRGEPLVALGLAFSFFWIPAACIQIHSTAVDLHTALFLIGAVYFATRSPFRMRDALMTGLALVFAIAAKFLTAIAVVVVALLAATRLIAVHGKQRIGRVLAVIAGVFVAVSGTAMVVFIRNYLHFGNPVYPHLVSDRWPGALEKGQAPGSFGVNLNLPFSEVLGHLTSLPNVGIPDGTPSQSYGIGVPFVLLPLVCIALAALLWEIFAIAVAHGYDAEIAKTRRYTLFVDAMLLALVAGAMFYTSPARWSARYNFMVVAVAMALVCWLCTRHRMPRVAEMFAMCMIFGGLLSGFWREPDYLVTWTDFKKLWDTPFPLRETALERGPTGVEYGVARETKMRDGDIVAFTDTYGYFPSLLWNSRFSNKLVYIPSSPDYVAQAEAIGASWLMCDRGDDSCANLNVKNPKWEATGHASVESLGIVYRRRDH